MKKDVDFSILGLYNAAVMEKIDRLKEIAILVAKETGTNIKVELNVNLDAEQAKCSVQSFF